MATKRVTFEYVFEYDEDNFPDYTDSDFESMAFSVLEQNIHDMGTGRVETIDSDDTPVPPGE